MDYYHILGVDKSADQTTIKKAYITLSRKYHPDKLSGQDKIVGEEKFKEISEAYNILSDSEKRNIYDRHGKEGLKQNRSHHTDNIKPIEIDVELSLEEIYNGTTTDVTFQRISCCKTCDGNGTKDKKKHSCNRCNGTGNITQKLVMGGFINNGIITCTKCFGRGVDLGVEFCDICEGKNKVLEIYITRATIFKGSSRLILYDIGHEVKDIGRGAVVLNIRQLHHDVFERFGKLHLKTIINISLAESICGFKRVIKHLDGRNLAIIADELITDGQDKIIINEGFICGEKRGNLICTFAIDDIGPLTLLQKQVLYRTLSGKELPTNKLEVDEYLMILEDITIENEPIREENIPGCRTQ